MVLSSRLRPLRLPLRVSPWLSVCLSRFSGRVAFLPCSLTPSSVPSELCHSGYSDSGGGAGETSPAARSAARDFFCYPSPAGWRHPVRLSGEVVRGGSWNNHRDNARCAYRNRNHPGNRNDNLGFRVVLRSSHVLPPLLLVSPAGWDGASGIQVSGVFRQCRPIRASD
ncbi:SUMF1/EgtB/PvdO family nonheme iron enzyme [Accumulibacter sp.]|uniref:SUMF1/EgtB/PvdO family nonheme iron enzyme n=1 Tax=Accumulibacter sp. TaxID=2053492 RepID=UPI002629AEB4|nr:SUMF1/EgtB/PvdO family nonheme iron enzyme [Accumulibacter sp.]